MRTITADEATRRHWGDTVVLQGETPLDYAIRRQAEANGEISDAERREQIYAFKL